jgi:hypothetical protein
MGKLGSALACLLFAVPFGGVGVFATWAIGSTLNEAWRAQEWVRVKASVENASLQSSSGSEGGATYRAEGSYRYVFAGKQYAGSRLGLSKVGGSDNIDDWHHEVNARLEDARAAGKPVTVWVNPENPAEAVLDREIRWGELLFLVPFSLAFGGVGVGALVAMFYVLKGKGAQAGGDGTQAALDEALGTASKGAAQAGNATPRFLWVFAFFWNSMSWPIAILVVKDIAETGEWAGLLVLLFPLVGLGLLWAAVATTWQAFAGRRRGPGPARGEAARPAPARTAPGTMAAQAARAMFDPQGGARFRGGFGASDGREPDIPPAVAAVEESAGLLKLRYSGRRHLAAALGLFVAGGIVTAIGAAMFAAGDVFLGAAAMIVVGVLLDVGAVALLAGRLVVTVRPGEIAVEKSGLFGRKSWALRRESVRSLRPVISYTVNGLPYFSLFAEAADGRVPLGTSLKGAEIADAVSRRIARALGSPASLAVPAGSLPIPQSD